MDERNLPPFDQDYYETGSTRPPKSHGGLIAGLLIAAILIFGLCRTFDLSIGGRSRDPEDPMGFYPTGEANKGTLPGIQRPAELPTVPGGALVQLQPAPDAVENVPQEGGLSLQEIYLKNINSVVSITCALENGISSGTGVVLSSNGYLVTNCHVVSGARAIEVRLTDDRVFPAALVGADAVSDLAVLYVEAEDLTPAEFGSSDAIRVGDAVAAIGDPLGVELRGTMTNGIVSAINRNLSTGGRTMTLIQTNAALNSGNSGGPLINCYGQVIGINTMKIGAFVDDAGVEGLGFAIPSTTVKEIVDQLIAQGYVSGRPGMGITGETVSGFYQRYFGLPAGVYITEVTPGGPGEKAGLAARDVLTKMNGRALTCAEDLTAALAGCQAGDTVSLEVWRDRQKLTLTLRLGQAGA